MFETQITKLLEDVQARSASILVEGDLLAIYNASKLPPELKEEIRRLKPQLLSRLRDESVDDYDPVVVKALELFGGSVVTVMSVEEYQQRFNTSFPGYTRPTSRGDREPPPKNWWRN
jgi:hypothetical protein